MKTLFKSIFFISLIVCANLNSLAAITYSFVASSGTYTANSAPTTIHAAGVDDALSAAINIGFTFNYGGCTSTAYTQVKVSSNGWMSFAHPGTSNSATNDLSLTTLGKVIAPLWDDLAVGAAGTVNYKLTGSAPNRVFTVEWKQMKWYWGAGGPAISFQAKLYETSNKIEFVYSQETSAISSGSASIGINGAAAGDYYSLNGTGASPVAVYGTQTSNLNTKPATGQIYTWNAPTTMSYVSSNISQPNTSNVYVGTNNQEIIRVEVVVSGGCTPFSLTQLVFNMIGTTALTDVTNIDVYYTGTISTFTASTLFGSVAPAAGNITLNGSQVLQDGTNYFWIVYDISSSAVLLDFLDAGCTQITVNSINQTPTGNPPAGNRQIVDAPSSFSKWIELGWARSVVTDGGTNLVWAGSTLNTYSSGASDIYIVKTDINASSIIWSTVIGGAANSERANDIIKTSDGYVVVGYTQTYGAGGWDMVISKVNLTGTHQWTKTIGLTSSTDESYGVTLCSDGNIAICGTIYYSTDSENHGYFAKIDQSNGSILSEKYLDGTGSTYLNNLTQTADGGYLLVGYTNNSDFYMTKLSSTLSVDFGYTWGGASNDVLTGVIENSANNYTVFGSSYSYGSGSRDGYAMRFTASGSTITNVWTKAYGTIAANSFNSVVKDVEGNYALTGITSRLDDATNDEAWFVKIDASNGNALLFKSIGTTNSGEDEEGYGVTVDANNDYIIAGLHNSAIGPNFYMVKVSSTGYTCASIQDNGVITNLTSPTLTVNSNTRSVTSTKNTPAPIVNTGGSIVTDCITITSVVLPIELVNFSGKISGDDNLLYWTTASERNNDYFTLERSYDAYSWTEIADIDGAGNSTKSIDYTFLDILPFSKITYYRLKQTDFDGVYSYSNSIALQRKNNFELFSQVYPNPTINQFSFDYNGKKQKYSVSIFDAIGQLVYVNEFDGAKSTETINCAHFSKGVYFVQFTQNELIIIKKIIKN